MELTASLSSAAPSSERFRTHAKSRLNFRDDDFRWHRHAAAHVRSSVHTIAVGNRGSDFFCQPASHIEFWHENMFGVLRGLTDFLTWPWTERFDLDQSATNTLVLEKADGLSPL